MTDRPDEDRLIEQTLNVVKVVEQFKQDRAASGVSTAQININAGGVGVWIAVSACLMTFSCLIIACVFVANYISDINQQTRELRQQDIVLQAYINAGYTAKQEQEKEK